MKHPFERLSNATLGKLFWLLFLVTATISFVFSQVSDPLTTAAAPNGIVSFELAGTPPKAKAILDSWDSAARMRAGFIQGLDYLFLVVYSTTCGAACIWAGRVFGQKWAACLTTGRWLAWGLWAAAFFDAVENAALVVLLFGAPASPWPEIAAVAAVIKFTLLLAGVVFGLSGAVVWVVNRLRQPARATL